MSEGGAHAPGAGDDDRLVRQVRLLTQPRDRALRQVAAGFCSPGPRFPAGGDGGLEQAVEARIPLSPRPGPAQRLADLVQHLILPDDDALQPTCHAQQMGHSEFAGPCTTRLVTRNRSYAVKLPATTRAQR